MFFVLMVCSIGAYYQTFDNPLVFDTLTQFTDLKLKSYVSAFSILSQRSIALLSFGVLYDWFGNDWFWQYVLNAGVHGFNAFLVFVFLRKLFSSQSGTAERNEFPVDVISLIAALIFVIHPVAIYATAYLVQRTILMGTMFALISVLMFQQALSGQNRSLFLTGSLLTYFLSIHSKEHGVMLPAIFVLLCLSQATGKDKSKAMASHFKSFFWFYLLCAVLAVQVTFPAQHLLLQVYEPQGKEMLRNAQQLNQISLNESNAYALSLITQCWMFFRYLFVWICPLVSMIFIDVHLPFATSVLSFPETAAVVLFCVYLFSGARFVFGSGWRALLGFAMLAPAALFATEFSVVRLSEQFVLYRSYFWIVFFLPVLGLFLPLVARFQSISKYLLFAAALYVCYLGYVFQNRVVTFDSELALWRDTVDKVDRQQNVTMYKNYRPFNNLANKLMLDGRYDEAIPYYEIGLTLNPHKGLAYANLAFNYFKKNDCVKAKEYYGKAISLDSGYVPAYIGYGMCVSEEGKFEEASRFFSSALRLDGSNADAWLNLGNVYFNLKQFDKATACYRKSVFFDARRDDAYHNLAVTLVKLGKVDEAIQSLRLGLKTMPNNDLLLKKLNELDKGAVGNPN